MAPGAFATLERRGPQGRAQIWGCVFVQRCRKRRMARPEGPSQCFGYYSFVEERRSSGEARRAEPTSAFLVTSDQKRHRHLAIGSVQGNHYVTLSSSVLFRAIAFQQTVLPSSRALILCAIARISLKMTDLSKTGSRNMAETCAINF